MGSQHSALENLVMFAGAYHHKRVLLTGHTGFKGAWMALWLHRLGAEVHGLALPPEGEAGVYSTACRGVLASEAMVDIRDAAVTSAAIHAVAPDMVFHLAAQPLVRLAYRQPLETLATNVMGTAHVLDALRMLPKPPQAVVVVTSDKCYENHKANHLMRETDAMGGHDPYSASKGAAEIIAAAWRRSYFHTAGSLRLATARGGNVIGGGDWADERLVPDCIRSLVTGQTIALRNPGATRPWQHVLDCLSGYLWLGARLTQTRDEALCTGVNFGPDPADIRTVRQLVTEVLGHWPGTWEDLSHGQQPHEAQFLQLSIEKAATLLGWSPVWDFADTVRHTVSWYRQQQDKADMAVATSQQIANYENDAVRQGAAWASTT